nr:MAG TPA: hypothetical protein [Caudoviricetes sp.]
MGGALKGAQIGLGGFSRARVCACVHTCARARVCVSGAGVQFEHVFDDVGHEN